MLEKFKNHFIKFGPRRFVWFTVTALVVIDLLSCQYFKIYWIDRQMAVNIVKNSMALQGISPSDFNSDTLSELTQMANNFFFFFLILIVLNNLFFYIFYLKKKLWAQGYVLFYTITGAILNITIVFEGMPLGPAWFVFNLLTIVIYLYLYLGVKLLKSETTIPEKEK